MTIENEVTQINFVPKEKDGGKMVSTLQQVYDLTVEIQSATDIIKDVIDSGYEAYKEQINPDAKKGDYSKYIKKSVAEILEGKVSEEVKVLENIVEQVDLVRKNLKGW